MSFVVSVQAILLSPQFHCAEEILTIVSLLSVDSVLHNPPAQRDEVQAVRKKFISSEGDHLTLLNVYRAYKSVNGHKVGRSELPVLSELWGEEVLAESRVTPASSMAGVTGILQSREKSGLILYIWGIGGSSGTKVLIDSSGKALWGQFCNHSQGSFIPGSSWKQEGVGEC